MAKNAKLPWDYIFSAENFQAYKPSPKTYLGVAELLNIRPDQVMMVAAHHDDLASAYACGLYAVYIRKPQIIRSITQRKSILIFKLPMRRAAKDYIYSLIPRA